MEDSFRFQNLEVYTLAKQFIAGIYKITSSFPSSEQFALSNQLKRAAVSVALNIAEGVSQTN
jgi:four helix bundle protein